MTTALFTHPACLGHDTGPGHPEQIARLTAIYDALDGPAFAALDRREARQATLAEIARVHPQALVEAILDAAPARGHARIDADTVMSPGSGEAALRAAGAVCAAVDAVAAGKVANAFCAVRPPGHHAEPGRPMGFCLFNNVALGALHARAVHGHQRVAVIDFDVHHGNGTEAVALDDPEFFYASSHQSPLYPGTGTASHGRHIVNVPLDPGSGSDIFRSVYAERVIPALRAFQPDFILISAGFDAHELDPLAGLALGEEDYAWVTRRICSLADELCAGRVVSALEGGYHLEALGRSVAAHVRALMDAADEERKR